MDSCPYCGETIAASAAVCPKCGVMLDEGAAATEAASGSATKAKELSPAAPAKKKTLPCPKCEKPVPVNAHRCKACGHAIREIVSAQDRAAEAAFARNVKLGVFGAIVLAIAVVIGGGLLRSGGKGAAKPVFERVKFDDLATMVGPKTSATRRKEHWSRYSGKYVRWEGRITDIHRGGPLSEPALLIRHGDGPGKPDVRLVVDADQVAKDGVEVGAKVSYTGRLEKYGGDVAFTLSDGEVLGARP